MPGGLLSVRLVDFPQNLRIQRNSQSSRSLNLWLCQCDVSIRMHMPILIPELDPARLQQMSVVTSHALARYKVKFRADKVDTMLVQSLRLWDKLDKQLENYSTKLQKWFGWHFPEMEKIITDNLTYARVIKLMGIPLCQKGESNSRLSDSSWKHRFLNGI